MGDLVYLDFVYLDPRNKTFVDKYTKLAFVPKQTKHKTCQSHHAQICYKLTMHTFYPFVLMKGFIAAAMKNSRKKSHFMKAIMCSSFDESTLTVKFNAP